MIYELDKSAYERTRTLFAQLDHQLTAQAVIDCWCPGSIWVDSINQPRAAFMASPEGHFLVGYDGNVAFSWALNKLIMTRLLNKDVSGQHREGLVLVCHPEVWERRFDVVLVGCVPVAERRWHYLFERPQVDWRNHLPGGAVIERIDQALLGRPGLCIPEHLNRWMKHNWGSVESFLQQGLGFCAVRGHKIVSWCLTDCKSGSACEIGIRTLQEYRRRGLATLTAAATVEGCLCQGLKTIGWHCDETNFGSRGVAEKVGFVKEREYMSYICLADPMEQHVISTSVAPGSPGYTSDQNRKI